MPTSYFLKFKQLACQLTPTQLSLPIALALLMTGWVFPEFSYTQYPLDHLDRISFGVATLNDFDVTARVMFFYKRFLFVGLSFLLLLVPYVQLNNQIKASSSKAIWDGLGLILLALVIFKTLNFDTNALILVTLTGLAAVTLSFRATSKTQLDILVLNFIFSSAICVFIFDLNGLTLKTSLPSFVYCLTGCWLLLSLPSLNKLTSGRMLSKLLPFMLCIGFISPLSFEIHFVLSELKVAHIPIVTIYLIAVGLLGITCLATSKPRANLGTLSVRSLTIFLSALCTNCFYQPIAPFDWRPFEVANRVLPIQAFYEFGKIPIVQELNSHLLSEIFFPFLYTFIHGYQSINFLSYDFWIWPIYYLLCFLFLARFFASQYLALATVLFFPFLTKLIPDYFSIALLVPFAFDFFRTRPTYYSAMVLSTFVVFTVTWRLDLGIAVTMASFAIVVLDLFSTSILRTIKIRSLAFAGFSWFGIFFISYYLLYLIVGSELESNLNSALKYFSSLQSFGYLELSNSISSQFLAHYYLLPLMVVLSGATIVLLKDRFKDLVDFQYWSLLFLIGFYLANFQRGLVRHSFIENRAYHLSSFVYFIVGSLVFLCFQKSSRKGAVFLSSFILPSSALILFFQFPFSYPQSLFSKLNLETSSENARYRATSLESRDPVPQNYKDSFIAPLKLFMDQNFSEQSTFLDFINNPILYFYTGRQNPSYFSQGLLSSHDIDLQLKYIDRLKHYDIPIVLFYSLPPLSHENGTDGVPNPVRYPLIAEFIYQNYRPFTVLSGKIIWLRKDINSAAIVGRNEKLETLAKRLSLESKVFDLKHLPYLLGRDLGKQKHSIALKPDLETQRTSPQWNFVLPSNLPSRSSTTIVFEILNPTDYDLSLQLGYQGSDGSASSKLSFIVRPSNAPAHYLVRVSSQYDWWVHNPNIIQLKPTHYSKQKWDESELSRYSHLLISSASIYLDRSLEP